MVVDPVYKHDIRNVRINNNCLQKDGDLTGQIVSSYASLRKINKDVQQTRGVAEVAT